MPKIKRLVRHGVGAKISVNKKFLHPRAAVCSRYPNASKNDALDDLLVIGREEKVVCKRMQRSCILMRHDDFDNGQILHDVTRFCKVQQEGPVESLFKRPSQQDVDGGAHVTGKAEEFEGCEIPSILNEDISNF
jgi:hypothetical protein